MIDSNREGVNSDARVFLRMQTHKTGEKCQYTVDALNRRPSVQEDVHASLSMFVASIILIWRCFICVYS